MPFNILNIKRHLSKKHLYFYVYCLSSFEIEVF